MIKLTRFLRLPKQEPLFLSGSHSDSNESHARHPVPLASIGWRRLSMMDHLVNIITWRLCLAMYLGVCEVGVRREYTATRYKFSVGAHGRKVLLG